jgi:hypothetical protein
MCVMHFETLEDQVQFEDERERILKSPEWETHRKEHKGAALVIFVEPEKEEDKKPEAMKSSVDDTAYFQNKHVAMGCGCGQVLLRVDDEGRVKTFTDNFTDTTLKSSGQPEKPAYSQGGKDKGSYDGKDQGSYSRGSSNQQKEYGR